MFTTAFVLVILLLIFYAGFRWAVNEEKKRYNNGVCPRCGKKLKLSKITSDGERKYVCEDKTCGYITFVAWGGVDKWHEDENNKL